MNRLAGLVKMGRTYDYEDSRTTERMHRTIALLGEAGITRTVTHNGSLTWDWATSRDRHDCTVYPPCKVTWPEWATDEMFDLAATLADTALSARGLHNRGLWAA